MSEIPREIIERLRNEYAINNLIIEDFSYTSDITPNGDLQKYTGKELAIYRLAVLLSIVEGSYLSDPELGVNLIKYIYKPMTDENINDLETELRNKIDKYEKDFILTNMEV